MKTRKFNIFIPVIAILFAITASAFTEINNSDMEENPVMIDGYTVNDIPGAPCELQVNLDCSIQGSELCTVNGIQAYRFLSGTSCVSQLKKN
jgi:hypothetical protein